MTRHRATSSTPPRQDRPRLHDLPLGHIRGIPLSADLPRWLVVLAWGTVLLTMTALLLPMALTGGDLPMHLAIGKWTWEHGEVLRHDVFSYLSPGAPFVAHSWLSELLFYGIERTWGPFGLVLTRFLLSSLSLVVAYRTACLLGSRLSVIMLLAPVVLWIVWTRMEMRPQLFSSLFLTFELWVVLAVHLGRRSAWWLWVLPPLHALWINLHGGWPQGIATLATIMVAQMAMWGRARYLRSGVVPMAPWRLGPVVLACLLASCLNPYGLRLVYFPLEMEASWIRALGQEWQATYRVVGQNDAGFLAVIYWGLLGLVLIAAARRWRTVDLVPIASVVLWLVLSVWHLRALADSVRLTSPLIAAAASRWRDRVDGRGTRGRDPSTPAPVLVSISLMFALLVAYAGTRHQPYRTHGFSWSRFEPRCALATVAREGLSGRALATYARDYLAYWHSPAVRIPFVWEFVIGPERWAEWQDAWRDADTLQAFLERYDVDFLLLQNRDRRFVAGLEGRGWVLIHLDDRCVIMVPQRPDTADLIRREAYRIIRPWGRFTQPPTAAQATQILAEADRALQQCPNGATFAHAFRATALYRLGRDQEALQARLKIPKMLVID